MTNEDRYSEALRRFSSDLRMARQVFESMVQRQVEIEPSHWQLYLKAHLDGRDIAGAHDVLEQMSAVGVAAPDEVRWELVVAASRSGDRAQALSILDNLHTQGRQPPPQFASAVLQLYLSAGKFGAARAVLRTMAARGEAAQPSDYQRMIDDCVQRHAINDAHSLSDLMVQVGQLPTAEQTTQLVAMMVASGHVGRAAELVDKLRVADAVVSPSTVTQLFNGYAKVGDVAAAATQFAELTAAGVTPSSFELNTLLSAHLSANDASGAWAVAQEMVTQQRIPSGQNLERLVDVSLAAGNTSAASGAVDWMLMLGVPVPHGIANAVVGAHLNAKEVTVATRLLDELVRHHVPVERKVARQVVEQLASAGRLHDAQQWLGRFRKAKVLTQGQHATPLINAHLSAKDVDALVALIDDLYKWKMAPTSADASRVVAACTRVGRHDDATALLKRFVEQKIGIDEATYRELMWEYAKRGNHDATRVVYDLMVATGLTPDERHDKALEWASGAVKRRRDEVPGSPEHAAPASTNTAKSESTNPSAPGSGAAHPE